MYMKLKLHEQIYNHDKINVHVDVCKWNAQDFV